MFKAKIAKSVVIIVFAVATLVFSGCCGKKTMLSMPKEIARYEKETAKNEKAAEPDSLLKKTGLNFAVTLSNVPAPKNELPVKLSFFEEQYRKGVEMVEHGDLLEAMKVFKDLMERYPDSEEASVAALCLADIYFKLKNDAEALKAYKYVLERFPNSRAAENARAAIQYLNSFSKYEREHVPIFKSDEKLGGW